MKILIVEDVAADAELAVRAIRRAGLHFEHRCVETAEDLARECTEFMPDVVLSDFALPQFDGLAALDIVRAINPDLPFIFVSGTIGEETAIRSLRSGATDYVLKTNLSRLPSAIRRAVKDARERAALRLAEARVLHSERVFRSFMENLPGLAFIKDAQGRFTFVSRAAGQVLGHDSQDLLGAPANQMRASPKLVALEANDGEVLRTQASVHSILTLPSADGDRHWMMVKFPLVQGDGSEPGIGGIAMDLTKRMETEEALRLRDRAVEASVNPVLIVNAADPAMPLVYVNRAFERVTGYTREEVIGRNCRLLQGEDRDQPELEKIRRAIGERCDGQATLRNYRKDGSLFWNKLYITPVRDPRSGAVTHFVGVQHDITEIKRYQEEIEHQANHDALTGLANRNLLKDRLQQAFALANRYGRPFSVVFIDVDHFKLINDSLGHDIGDRLLKIVAERLVDSLREGDTVARLGGDEFVLLAIDQDRPDAAYRVVHKVMREISRPFIIDNRELKVTCSAGIANYPRDGEDGDTLLRNADTAMYRAKALGRNTFQLYSADMNANLGERLTLESDLWFALERGEFVLHFQPKVDLQTGRIVGTEALLRWNHPKRGLIGPDRFVAQAEESSLIVHIGKWSLEAACAQNRAWQDAGLPSIPVAVNMSPRHLHDPELVQTVRAALESSRLDPRYLEIELTEGAAMLSADQAIRTLTELRAIGLRISLDDFGTGYSSLSYLKRLPVNGLKIDRSFIHDLAGDSDGAIVRAIIVVAQELKLAVTAEGVETRDQARFLVTHACSEAQGYYFARPMPAEDVRPLLGRGILPLS